MWENRQKTESGLASFGSLSHGFEAHTCQSDKPRRCPIGADGDLIEGVNLLGWTMVSPASSEEARRFALIALGLLLLDKVTAVMTQLPALRATSLLPVQGILFGWILPIWIATHIEGRDLRSLGLWVRKGLGMRYALYTLVGAVAPALIVGVDQRLVIEWVEQVLYIGVAEEVFWRGYLQGRLCDWLGNRQGVLLSAFLFGVGHVVSLVCRHGLRDPFGDAQVFAQTFAGGLVLGAIYLRSKSIVPGGIVHASGNAYFSRLAEVLAG